MCEAKSHEVNSFITLTYSDQCSIEGCKHEAGLNKKHFQDFIKRLRKSLGKKRIKYFHCGEYGGKYYRPHFHAILFGHDFEDKIHVDTTELGHPLYESECLNALWKHGIKNQIGSVTFQSAGYVARYALKARNEAEQKGIDFNNALFDVETGEVLPKQYVTMSQGIGKDWIEKYWSDVYPQDELIVNGHPTKPPRYFDEWLKKHRPALWWQVVEKRKEANDYQRYIGEQSRNRLEKKEQFKKDQIRSFL